jgi:hypothetical protein
MLVWSTVYNPHNKLVLLVAWPDKIGALQKKKKQMSTNVNNISGSVKKVTTKIKEMTRSPPLCSKLPICILSFDLIPVREVRARRFSCFL